MSMEMPFPRPEESHTEEREMNKTGARFRLAVLAMLRANFASIEVKGEDNLKKIPPNAKVIFATTHISDFDVLMPIAKLGDRFRMKAVNASIQHNFREDALANIAIRIAGKDNTIPVDYEWGEHPEAGKSYYAKKFNPDNFEPMAAALRDGDAVVMAAYNPTPVKDGKLPPRGGNGVPYLAAISGATIVPISVNVLSADFEMATRKSSLKSIVSRPKAEMSIGQPITLAAIPDAEKLPEYIERGGRESAQAIHRIKKVLQAESDKIMLALAEALPKEKRGEWNNRPGASAGK